MGFGARRTEDTPVEFPWGNPIQSQYHLPELPRLNKSKIGFNWAGGAGWVKRTEDRVEGGDVGKKVSFVERIQKG